MTHESCSCCMYHVGGAGPGGINAAHMCVHNFVNLECSITTRRSRHARRPCWRLLPHKHQHSKSKFQRHTSRKTADPDATRWSLSGPHTHHDSTLDPALNRCGIVMRRVNLAAASARCGSVVHVPPMRLEPAPPPCRKLFHSALPILGARTVPSYCSGKDARCWHVTSACGECEKKKAPCLHCGAEHSTLVESNSALPPRIKARLSPPSLRSMQ